MTYAGVLCEACAAALPKICDFCSAKEASWCYPTNAFVFMGFVNSQRNWIACQRCHELIESKNHDGLSSVALETFIQSHPAAKADREAIASTLAELHAMFRSSRRGEPFRIDQ